MKFLKIIFLCLCSMTIVYAQSSKHMLSGSSDAGYSYNTNSGGWFSVGLTYSYTMTERMQLSSTLGLSKTSNYLSSSLSLGPIYNFGEDNFNSSFFASLKLGISIYDPEDYDSVSRKFVVGELGKRFSLSENISYSPSFTLSKMIENGGTNSTPSYTFTIFRIDIFL